MNIEYVGRNIQIDDALRGYTEDKLAKLVKFLDEPVEVRVTLSIERHRHVTDLHVAHRHGVLQATEETATEWRDAINATVDKLEKQARRGRKKVVDRRRRVAATDPTVETTIPTIPTIPKNG